MIRIRIRIRTRRDSMVQERGKEGGRETEKVYWYDRRYLFYARMDFSIKVECQHNFV